LTVHFANRLTIFIIYKHINHSGEIVKIGNVKCTPKKDIKTYLFMGVDQRGELTKIKKYNGTGQCDVLKVLVLDDKNKTYKTLTINRHLA